ncbi:MAG: amino acid decarboxylase, partial [Anaerolineae bacterium]|nr:amino acid decarboxylase [Anaerolineae bacterium]
MDTQLSLDPQNWDSLREVGHQMLDEMLDYLQTVRERPVWQPIPPEVKQTFQQAVPLEPAELQDVYAEFQENILPYPLGNIHPRFWGWVIGTGTPVGMLAEMLAAGMNPNVGGAEHAAVDVELQVVNWFKDMMGFPADSSGLLVSGGSMANLVGLTVARNAKAEFDIRKEGVQAAPRKMVLYSSR